MSAREESAEGDAFRTSGLDVAEVRALFERLASTSLLEGLVWGWQAGGAALTEPCDRALRRMAQALEVEWAAVVLLDSYRDERFFP